MDSGIVVNNQQIGSLFFFCWPAPHHSPLLAVGVVPFSFSYSFFGSPPLHRFPQKENLGSVNSHHILHSLALSVWNSQIRDRLPPKKESGNLLLVLDDVSFGFGFDTMTTLIARHGEVEAGVKAQARRWGSL